MRVLMITNNVFEDKIGGHERYVSELSSALRARGVEVTILAKRWATSAPDARLDGVVLERYRVPSKRNPLYAPLFPAYVSANVLRGVRRQGHGVVVHAHMSVPALPLAVAHRPYVYTLHAPVWRELLREHQGTYALPAPIQRPVQRLVRLAEREVVRRATVTLVLSEFMRAEMASLDARAGAQARLLPGGVDVRRFSPGPPDPDLARGAEPLLFTARRLTPRTGVDLLIRAMPLIRGAYPRARLVIAGVGPMERPLRELARTSGLKDAITFLGRVSDAQLVRWYRTATLVVVPTRELEGFGLATAEALASGAVVVGTPAGATPELLGPLDPALVSEDTSPPALARAVMAVLADPDRLAGLRRRARTRVVPGLAWDHVVDRHLEIYERLAGNWG